ncbi:MAG: 3-dehydro-L-gulonate 2-dehydrogenase [Verrucomicrobia bacterium]|nr:3-dehydro-L-gulonate 2-dehydrogenase [Verrucomicrobiota bacterium]
MKRIPFDEIQKELTRVLLAAGLEISKAERCALIFTQNTCDGVNSHGVNRFPNFVMDVKIGTVNPHAESERISSFGAIEQWDGNRGIGPLNAEKAMKRAIELSRGNGIGCVGLRNTNHWMRAGTYGLLAAEADCIGICWTNTIALMPPWGASEKKIGNNPLAICIPRSEGPVLLDMAMSQFSNGKLDVFRRLGRQLPEAGGYDQNGKLTTDPDLILKSHRALPIGYWKGSGLAIVLDLMATLISGGDSTKEISQREKETGVSQVFLAIDISSQVANADVDAKMNAIINDLLNTPPLKGTQTIRYPGQGMSNTRRENLEKGILVDSAIWKTILEL